MYSKARSGAGELVPACFNFRDKMRESWYGRVKLDLIVVSGE